MIGEAMPKSCRCVRRWRPCGAYVERGAFWSGKARTAEWLGRSNDGARGRQEWKGELAGAGGGRYGKPVLVLVSGRGGGCMRTLASSWGRRWRRTRPWDARSHWRCWSPLCSAGRLEAREGGGGGTCLTAPHFTCHLLATSALSRQLSSTRKKDVCHAHIGRLVISTRLLVVFCWVAKWSS